MASGVTAGIGRRLVAGVWPSTVTTPNLQLVTALLWSLGRRRGRLAVSSGSRLVPVDDAAEDVAVGDSATLDRLSTPPGRCTEYSKPTTCTTSEVHRGN